MDKINYIRLEEKKYHEKLYSEHTLYAKGSWLHKPVKTVMDLIPLLDRKGAINILDLGSGVGRNSIPLAQFVKGTGGKVVCVDILDSALEKLIQYSEEYKVRDIIQTKKADIGHFQITPNEFDFIVAISSLEHVQSESVLNDVLQQMKAGTKTGGINCIIVNSEVEEYDITTNKKLDPLFEINLSSNKILKHLKSTYKGWKEFSVVIKPLEYQISRNDRPVLLKTNAITFVAKKDI